MTLAYARFHRSAPVSDEAGRAPASRGPTARRERTQREGSRALSVREGPAGAGVAQAVHDKGWPSRGTASAAQPCPDRHISHRAAGQRVGPSTPTAVVGSGWIEGAGPGGHLLAGIYMVRPWIRDRSAAHLPRARHSGRSHPQPQPSNRGPWGVTDEHASKSSLGFPAFCDPNARRPTARRPRSTTN